MPVIDLEAVHEGETHLEWAARVARSIARAVGFRANTDEEDELVAVAHHLLWRRAVGERCKAFDLRQVPAGGNADGQFRGWCHRSVQGECLRAAKRLRGAIVNQSASNADKVQRVSFESANLCEDGEGVMAREEDEGRSRPILARRLSRRLWSLLTVIDHITQPTRWHECGACGNKSLVKPTEPAVCFRCARPLQGTHKNLTTA